MSDSSSSLPSQSTLRGSSIETSALILLFLLRYIRISFSMHLEAYVASLIFLSLSYELIALISPIVPIDIKSSTPTPVLSNFFAIYTTSLKLCSIRVCFASASEAVPSASIAFCSSLAPSGAGNISVPPI